MAEDYFRNIIMVPDGLSRNEWRVICRCVYEQVCRVSFSAPGFALLNLSEKDTSLGQRKIMFKLKDCLSEILQEQTGRKLGWYNMNRFDQKNTTKLHRDGAPDESLLILGYEPTKIRSRISIADYSQCAYDSGITPESFLRDFNPMYEKGMDMLKSFTRSIDEFNPAIYQILVLNNSMCKFGSGWQGVLHGAEIESCDAPRVINSTCVFPISENESDKISRTEQEDFLAQSNLLSY